MHGKPEYQNIPRYQQMSLKYHERWEGNDCREKRNEKS